MGAACQAEKMASAQETLLRALQNGVLTEGRPPSPIGRSWPVGACAQGEAPSSHQISGK